MSNQDTNQVDDKIIDRIKKMMALANCSGATEGERDNALRMAYNLLAKHNLSMNEVETHNPTKQENRESQESIFLGYPWARSIANTVGNLFFCKYYFSTIYKSAKAKHTFIGRASNVATAQYLSDFVVQSVCRETRRLYGSALAPEARCFAVGVATKLRERVKEIKNTLEQESAPGTALAIINLDKSERAANSLWLAEQGVALKKTTARTKGVTDSDAYSAGKDFGAKVNLSAQIGGNRATVVAIGR